MVFPFVTELIEQNVFTIDSVLAKFSSSSQVYPKPSRFQAGSLSQPAEYLRLMMMLGTEEDDKLG